MTVSETVSDVERLTSAMRFLVEGTMDQFVQIYGRRALQALEVQFNAATALGTARGLFLKNGRMSDNGEGGLLERSQVYAAALSHLLTVNSRIAGRRFVDRELRSLYRLMPWEEREIGDEHLFRRLDWMRGVQRVFTGTRSAHSALLRSLPLFAGLGEEDLAAISDQLRPETYRKGMDIVRQRQPGSTFYVIESGTVEVWLRHQDGTETLEVELGRGDYFGERSLLSNAPRAATCRCRSRVRALSLDKGDFDRLVAVRFQVAANLDEAAERTGLLATMPLFVEVTPTQVKVLASRMVSESLPAGSPIIRQGDLGEKFYVVKAGAVRVSRGVEGQDEVIVGRLGRGEYFGEIALLMKVPRTATVTAETDVELLSLDASSFEGMVRDYLQSSQGLQQASSRRMIQLRKTVSMAYRGAP